ncbi:MAG: phosphoethanolamine transferase CptA [Clostridiales bacterium]|nr:phosphoethanolamine transferase CptA [Clostridiales bacterium]
MEMEKIKGTKISHRKYGSGCVESLSGNYMMVVFSDGILRKFRYPDAFEKFLKIEDDNLTDDVEIDLNRRRLEEDYIDYNNAQKVFTDSLEFTRRKKEEQEKKRLQQIEKQRRMQRMREQVVQQGSHKKTWNSTRER